MMEQVFRRHANEGLGKRAVDLPPQRVKVLSWRGAIDDAHVVRPLRVPPHPPCLSHPHQYAQARHAPSWSIKQLVAGHDTSRIHILSLRYHELRSAYKPSHHQPSLLG